MRGPGEYLITLYLSIMGWVAILTLVAVIYS